ncbi:GIY-YIG nuclease family protein [Massilibacterium senegalense]|uniref:GIY-YIG nuclease family protein n=1 Tax=Massilibacterium senegalense TaxID=1632858 RepID=UPI00078499EC|nr:GIY-YIG nuclease family protein [Massilibacterium senegalense]
MNIPKHHTLYHLEVELLEGRTIQVGKLGTFFFQKGTYVYVGSAKKNIQARITRHMTKDKVKRWHIDYVTQYATTIRHVTYSGNEQTECELAKSIQKKLDGKVVVKKFGSSDCSCVTHFFYIG